MADYVKIMKQAGTILATVGATIFVTHKIDKKNEKEKIKNSYKEGFKKGEASVLQKIKNTLSGHRKTSRC